ncbi:TIGR04076 family protein [Christensenellaceae bacterium OttesenSCG-928-K19]|nr:TIGR04076 family protein [Christensenellaceae bacterium OttesenSCG-928-K19]
MSRPKITITLVDKKEDGRCHYAHKVGDRFDFGTQRGELCPMAMHVAFPYVDIMRYDGRPPGGEDGRCLFCCPDPKVINVFEIKRAPQDNE